ncbi:MAG: hypothetical protein ACRC0X_02245 [Brevinema sp.]
MSYHRRLRRKNIPDRLKRFSLGTLRLAMKMNGILDINKLEQFHILRLQEIRYTDEYYLGE